MTLRVSVIIPAHDSSGTIAAAVGSAQRSHAEEIIVVDDASTDDSALVASQIGGVTVTHRNVSGGPAVARNEGLRLASGDAVIFLDSDDELLPGALDALRSGFGDDVVAVMGRFEAVGPNGEPLDIGTWASEQLRPVVRRRGRYIDSPEGFSSEALVTRLVVPPPSGILVRRDVALRIGGYDESLRRSEDIDFLVRLSREGILRGVPNVVVRYRRAPGQRSQATAARRRGRQRTLIRMIWGAPHRQERWQLARGAAAHHFDRAAVRWGGAAGHRDRLVAARSYLLGCGFRITGVAAFLRP